MASARLLSILLLVALVGLVVEHASAQYWGYPGYGYGYGWPGYGYGYGGWYVEGIPPSFYFMLILIIILVSIVFHYYFP